jgi:NTP pyrophosphatase (non-canonical NTP hydrolase)
MNHLSEEDKESIKEFLSKSNKDIAINYLHDVQIRLKKWQEKNFKPEDTSYEWCFIGAVEELGEIGHVLLKSRQGIREYQGGLTPEVKDKIADGVTDVIVFLLQTCSHLGIEIAPFFFEEVERVMARDWTTKKENGVK